MYSTVSALGVSTVAGVVAAVVLPNTGVGTSLAATAVAVIAGLLTWGTIYSISNK